MKKFLMIVCLVMTGQQVSADDAIGSGSGSGSSTTTSVTTGSTTTISGSAGSARICGAPRCTRGIMRFDLDEDNNIDKCVDNPAETNPRVLGDPECIRCTIKIKENADICI